MVKANLWSVLDKARTHASNLIKPAVTVTDPLDDIVVEWNQPVIVRDGTTLRANVFRPKGDDPVPVIMSAHIYNKDKIPANSRSGRSPSFQNRVFLQPDPISFSAWTSWEAPDPAFWVKQGYAVVNCDLRGGGASEGVDTLFSHQEAEDYFDLIEWAGVQPWSTGKVGLLGVSYLAITQYRAASLQPPHLAAICPWEGFSDLYRDFARPGGVLENGFSIMWSKVSSKSAHVTGDFRQDLVAHETRDQWYEERTPMLEDIEVPMLVCGSFSDQNLHSRGSFQAFSRAGSSDKWLYTHRSGKWSTFYSEEAMSTQAAFFDWALKGETNGWDETPRVRLAIIDHGPDPVEIRGEAQWPPTSLEPSTLFASWSKRCLEQNEPTQASSTSFDLEGDGVRLDFPIERTLDTIGPMAVRLVVELHDCSDANLFVGVRKFRRGKELTFEGSYGFSGDMVTHGMQRIGFIELDEVLSTPYQPVHTFTRLEPMKLGEQRVVEVALLPQATRWFEGDVLQLHIQGRWFYDRNPVTGQFPAGYAKSPMGRVLLRSTPDEPATLTFGHCQVD